MPKLTAQEITEDQIKAVSNKVSKYQANVQKPSRSFKTAALAANDKRINRLRKSIDDGTYERAMQAVDEAEAIATASKSGQALADGVTKRRNKILRFHEKFGPIRERIQSEVNNMAQASQGDRDQKMLENAHRLQAAKGTWR